MDDASLVRGLERLGDLPRDVERFAPRSGCPSVRCAMSSARVLPFGTSSITR